MKKAGAIFWGIFLFASVLCFQNDVFPAQGSNSLWLWGEVVEVDALNGRIAVKYADADISGERVMHISVTGGTKYYNVAGLAEIKPGDNISADYDFNIGEAIASSVTVDNSDMIKEAVFSPGELNFTKPPSLEETVNEAKSGADAQK